jgi:hypothetical protein
MYVEKSKLLIISFYTVGSTFFRMEDVLCVYRYITMPEIWKQAAVDDATLLQIIFLGKL